MHMRRVHGYSDPMCKFIDGSGTCPACGASFHMRIRCLAQVCDSRRTKCKDAILSCAFPKMSADVLHQLTLQDRSMRCEARKNGHSHPNAIGAAKSDHGKCIGHAGRCFVVMLCLFLMFRMLQHVFMTWLHTFAIPLLLHVQLPHSC